MRGLRKAVCLVALVGGSMDVAHAAQSGAVAKPGMSTQPIERRSAAQLQEQGRQLLAQAQSSAQGIASVTLERYPGHLTMLTARTKSGGAEEHANWNDIFVVLDGEASEVTGGTIVDRKEQAGGEVRGSRVEGGTPTPMHKGDVIHISPGVPHQTVLEPGKTFVYYVIKIEKPGTAAQ